MSGGPNSPVGPRDPSPFSDEGGLQGILAQWNNTNQQLVQIVQALKSIVYLFPGSYTFATLPPAGQ
ncbi:MAG TPA: hypothetical protein VMW56_10530, partial [Candidatus Margulisiibacteriota bacterium]|nr:hypothetical protein [Candidatus Margulisiibacteriota bacterium]